MYWCRISDTDLQIYIVREFLTAIDSHAFVCLVEGRCWCFSVLLLTQKKGEKVVLRKSWVVFIIVKQLCCSIAGLIIS